MMDVGEKSQRVFRSAKRLIGAKNSKHLEYTYNVVDGSDYTLLVPISGRDATAMLAQFLYRKAEPHFRERWRQAEPLKLNKAVVAVPNNFTPAKIEQMKQACRCAGISHVEHIYEAEAVLLFYLWKQNSLLEKQDDSKLKESKLKEIRRAGEYVLVVDFGGGSVNFTYARIRTVGANGDTAAKTQVTVLQRIGFGFGGDHIDYLLSEILWDGIKHNPEYENCDPFGTSDANGQVRKTRKELVTAARGLKSTLIEYESQDKRDMVIPLTVFEVEWKPQQNQADEKQPPKLTFRFIEQRLQTVKKTLEEGIDDLLKLCEKNADWGGLHTIIFSGRSSRFPGVRDAVREKLKEEKPTETMSLVEIDLGLQAKTCVARGAAYYGLQKDLIELQRFVAFAHYGVRVQEKPQFNAVRFESVIAPGFRFQNGWCVGQKKNIHVPYQNTLALYQVMAAEPAKVIQDPKLYFARLSKLGEVNVSNQVPIDLIQFKLRGDTDEGVSEDKFEAVIQQSVGIQSVKGNFETDDIRTEHDESVRWLLD
jgi:molecular chaperone DnaK (HSP70)